MSDDLVKRLRAFASPDAEVLDDGYRLTKMCHQSHEAADRIEELEGQLQSVLDRETSILRYYDAKLDAAEAKLATMLVVGDAMAAFIEGNYYVSGIVKMWRGLAAVLKTNKLKGEQP